MQIQTITFISHLKHKGINGPFLVVGPLSTLSNWINEFQRFCPDLPAVMYHGSKQEREKLRSNQLHIGGMLSMYCTRQILYYCDKHL